LKPARTARRNVAASVLGALAFATLFAAAPATAPPGPSQDPTRTGQPPDDPDDRAERDLMSERAVRENCLICHGEEMIASQRLTPRQWQAEVEKMVGWGSPLPPEMQGPVVEYLAARYPESAPAPRPERWTIARALDLVRPRDGEGNSPTGDAGRGGPLYARHCANCHGDDGQGAELGPNLVEKPVLRRPTEFDEFIRKGRGRMPAFSSLIGLQGEADVLAWLRGRRYQPGPLK
jgi:mono/diheme cytochrome c family protein